MKRKDLKKLIPALASVIALSIGSLAGFGDLATNELEGALVAIGTAAVTILSVFGVWTNNDKS